MRKRNILFIAVLIVTLGVLAHPFYMSPHAAQTAYTLQVDESVSSQPNGTGVAYDSLSDDTRSVFDEARQSDGQRATVYDPSPAMEELERYDYIEHEDQYYTYSLEGKDMATGMGELFRNLISGLAGLLLAISSLAWFRQEKPRPTTSYLLIAISGSALGAFTVQLHDNLFTPANISLWPPHIGISMFLIAFLLICWATVARISTR